jgi:hypothetical protein
MLPALALAHAPVLLLLLLLSAHLVGAHHAAPPRPSADVCVLAYIMCRAPPHYDLTLPLLADTIWFRM